MSQILPLAGYLVVSRLEEAMESPAGIVLPDSAKEKPQKGKVLAVGAGKPDKNGNSMQPQVQVGQTVLFKKYGPTELKLDDGQEVLILEEDDVLAIVQ